MDTKNPNSPTKLTEFAPLSSEVKQSGGFFSKLFRRSPVDSSQQNQPSTEQQDTGEETEPSGIGNEPLQTKENVPEVIDSSPQPCRRTLSSVLRRLSNILDTRGQTPHIYKDSDFKQFWMPDRHCKECYECGDRFNTFRRRHHCRICGQIFCSRCCNQEVPGKIMGYTGFLRVCTYCCRVVLSYAQSREGSSDFEAFGEDLRQQMMSVAGEMEQGLGTQQDQMTWTPRKGYRVQMSTIFDEESRASDRSSPDVTNTTQKSANLFDMKPITDLETLQTIHQERICLLKDSKQLKEISQCLIHPDEGLELQSHRHHLRTYPGCLVGSEIVDWLVMKEKAVSREQAVVIGQALLDGGWLECVSANQQLFSDLYSLYRPQPNASEEKMTTEDFEQSIPAPDDPEDDSAPLWFKAIEQNHPQEEESIRSISELNKIPSTVSVPENLNTSSKSVFFVETPQDTLQHVKAVPRCQPLSAKSLNEKECTSCWKSFGRAVRRSDSGGEPHLDSSTDESVHNHSEDNSEDWEIVEKPKANHDLASENRPTDFSVPPFKGTSPSEEVQKVELATSGSWQENDLRREDNIDRISYDRLKESHREHTISLVRQLLRDEGLSPKWTDTIINISQHVAGQVKPDVKHNGDDMDIRQYVIIKKIPGSLKSHCSIVSGVVCTKVIAHKRMKHNIANPKILLLRGPIEYQRVENKFSSLEPQILQEHEFLKNCVNRIAALEPNILLVEKTVSRLAQEFILDAGITLILNVKPSVMERVARFTQADIVTSIDGLVSKTTMGFCHSFSTQTYILSEGKQKNLLYFEGCASHLGCTVTLRGGSLKELAKVKRILHFVVYVAYHSKLEVAFLMDEFAMPPPARWENTLELLNPVCQSEPAEKVGHDACRGVNADGHNAIGDATNQQSTESDPLDENKKDDKGIESDSGCQFLKILSIEESGKSSRSGRSPSRSRASPRIVDVATTEILDQSDPLQNYQISRDESIFQKEPSGMLTEVKQTGDYFKEALSDTILSISPYIKYDIPYLETETGAKCELRKYFMKEIYWSEQFLSDEQKRRPEEEAKDVSKIKHQHETFVTKYHPFVTLKITAPVMDPKTQALMADFRARGGHNDVFTQGKYNGCQRMSLERESSPFVWDHKVDCLDPMRHQRIALLFSSYAVLSPNHPNPCVSPWVVTMDYYGRNDITLGGFLERYCFRESYTCPSKTCDVPMSEHIRRFVHEQGSLLVVLKRLEKPMPAYQDNILMWEWCRKCKEVTPVVPMSSETWSMSFAKYLELKLQGKLYNKRSTSSSCEHNIHQQHFQYFGYKDTVASFKYFPITLKEICLPPMIVDIGGYDVTIDQWRTQESLLSYKGLQVFSNILDQLLKCQTQAQTDTLARVVTDYVNQVQSEKARFMLIFDELKDTLAKMEECYNNSTENQAGTRNQGQGCDQLACQVMDSIVKTKRVVTESVLRWNAKIVEFLQQQKKYEKERSKFLNVTTQKEASVDDNNTASVHRDSSVRQKNEYITKIGTFKEDSSILEEKAYPQLGISQYHNNWMSKEDDLETEPTFVVKDTPSIASDAKPTFVSKETEGERGSLSIDESESSSLSGLDKNEAKQMGK
ncbi:hypothetical protein LSH36_51g02001 [Paralvinella palmiformis]|uniref:1-phosphatidylinositol-3-phosphate 5-kinase n=1 Tax=Paralvinella palmiformis TaxID=53620 RepID=A0AAD9NE82_9ANNE|nr:hypothetical protein LSH36_51g02001 [Paralvinella palmiformis]